MEQIRNIIGHNSEKPFNRFSCIDRPENRKEVNREMGIKHCPKCGSTNVNSTTIYQPSVWKCLDCGHEGAFIIEGDERVEEMLERHEGRCSVTDWLRGTPRIDEWNGSADSWHRI